MSTALPGGWMEEPRLKARDNYLSHVTWIGEAVPDRYMGPPWGLGGECWWVRAWKGDPGQPERFEERKIFAGMDPDALVAAARQWAADGFVGFPASR
jgi:hypothetical protein